MSNFLNKLKALVKSKAFLLYFALIAFCALVFATHQVEHVVLRLCLFLLPFFGFCFLLGYLSDEIDWINKLKNDKKYRLLVLGIIALTALCAGVFAFLTEHRLLRLHLYAFSEFVIGVCIISCVFEFKSSKIFRIFMLCFALLISGFVGFVCQYPAVSAYSSWLMLLGWIMYVTLASYIILQNKLKVLMLLLAAATSGALGYAIGYAWAVYTREDVYVVGKNGYGPVLWKNGKLRYLSDGNLNTQAASVFVSDGNVYVAGNERGGELGPVIWENGAPQRLPVFFDGQGAAKSLFVFGKDVYVAGYEYVRTNNTDPFLRNSVEYLYTNRAATLWINGVPQRLSNGDRNSEAHSVYVSDNNVYVAGYEYVVEDEREVATLWINGVPQRLSDGASWAHSVFVSGGNIYVAGQEFLEEGSVATLWKNGAPHRLAAYGSAWSVFVSGSDIYVAGKENNSATLWKNGNYLPLSDVHSCALSVYVWGNDVYVAGWEHSEWNGDIVDAMVWKNGSPQRLIAWSPRAEALSVFVK